jgi:antirestriction protein ArdC
MAQFDIYESITNKILEQLSKGIIPWQRPWHGGLEGAKSYVTGKPYSLLNQLLLGREGYYLTWKQISDLGGTVKKGCKSNIVVFYKMTKTTETKMVDGEIKEEEKLIPVLRYYTVFHEEDCEGIPMKGGNDEPKSVLSPVKEAEKVIAGYYGREACKLNIELSNRAFYSPSGDYVTVPAMEQYDIVEEYYSTLFHETTHSTGHSSRLNRDMTGHFGSDSYSKEELVAELGAAFLVQKCGMESEKAFKNSAAYIQSWSKKFKEDKKLIVSAASKAEKAVKFILTGERPTPVK